MNIPFFVPLPFKKGDIVRVNSPFHKTYYGVVPCEWERRPVSRLPMFTSVDLYLKDVDKFGYTDDTEILELEACADCELPEDEEVLKLIRDVYTGELNFVVLLYYYGNKELDVLLGKYRNASIKGLATDGTN